MCNDDTPEEGQQGRGRAVPVHLPLEPRHRLMSSDRFDLGKQKVERDGAPFRFGSSSFSHFSPFPGNFVLSKSKIGGRGQLLSTWRTRADRCQSAPSPALTHTHTHTHTENTLVAVRYFPAQHHQQQQQQQRCVCTMADGGAATLLCAFDLWALKESDNLFNARTVCFLQSLLLCLFV